MNKKMIVDSHEIAISNPDKDLFPPDNITKLDLCMYYKRIAPHLLMYAKHHPLSMHRYPHGIKQEGFFQKDASGYFPKWIDRFVASKEEGGKVHYVVANNAATLVYLANLACITPHLWLTTEDKPHYPDRMIFDMDPAGTADFNMVKWAAQQIKIVLDHVGLASYPMLTGSRGVHVVTPLKQVHTNEQVRKFAYKVARILTHEFPEHCTLEMRIANRGNKIFIDTLRNSFGQTAVAPFAVRAKPKAPVATPISWQELSKIITSQKYTIHTIFRRLRTKDPWTDMKRHAANLKTPTKKIDEIWDKLGIID